MAETYNASTDTNKSPLELISKQYQNTELAINRYSANFQYGLSNPDAISPIGEGENSNGEVGKKSDILERNKEVAINRYGPNNPYGLSNPDAISPIGEGENSSGQVGKQSDIIERNREIAINKFNENKGYPDF